MRLLFDHFIPHIASFLPEHTLLSFLREEFEEKASTFKPEALFVRTTLPVNEKTCSDLLPELKFVGSATAGIDHVDMEWLVHHGISFAHSPGCNSNAVAEYTLTSLLYWWSQHSYTDPSMFTVGIIGVGHVGSKVADYVQKLGFNLKLYDPPREAIDPSFTSCSFEEVLSCPIITVHTPLTHTGDHPTYHLIGEDTLGDRRVELLMNTARGGIIDEEYVLTQLDKGTLGAVVIDCWKNEPFFNLALAQKALIATPHIAGYSQEAKWTASRMIVTAFLTLTGVNIGTLGPTTDQSEEKIPLPDRQTLIQEHGLLHYDRALRNSFSSTVIERRKTFSRLRHETPLRKEFSSHVFRSDLF